MESFNLLIADDHPTFRKGLALLVQDFFPGSNVVAVASFDEALEKLCADTSVHLMLLDLNMPGMSGADSIAAIRATYPDCRVAVVTGSEDAHTALELLANGACGFLPKSLPESETVRAISLLRSGENYIPARLGADSIKNHAPEATIRLAGNGNEGGNSTSQSLSPRQKEVLAQLGQGRSNKEIARALSLSEGTIKVHLAAIFRALGARNRTEAVLAASKLNLM